MMALLSLLSNSSQTRTSQAAGCLFTALLLLPCLIKDNIWGTARWRGRGEQQLESSVSDVTLGERGCAPGGNLNIPVWPFLSAAICVDFFCALQRLQIWMCLPVCVCAVVTLQHVWCMHVFLLSAEGIEKHLFNLVCNWIWPMGMPCSSEKWQQIRRGWKDVAEGKRQGQGWQSDEGSGEKRRWHMDGRWEKYTEGRKGRYRRRQRREDTALHPHSSVRLHKYCVHGRVAGSQVNMTYEYCKSHSPPLLPSSIINVWLRVGSTLLETFLSTSLENKWET